MLVTVPPGGGARGSASGVVTLAGPDTVVMVVPSVQACEAALSSLDVDLGIVFTFRRIPDVLAAIPRHGMVNVHQSLLPAYRGANGFRSLYEAEPRLGATLHYLTPEFDSGPILAQASEPTPEDVDPASALEVLQRTAAGVLEAGVPRALAGEPGEGQDPSASSDAPLFTEEDAVLELSLTAQQFQCRFSALSLAAKQPSVTLDGARHPLRAARRLPGLTATARGVIRFASRRAIVAVADAVLELELGELPHAQGGSG
jgi:methionyl-tRNA formyltransferase